MYKFVCSLHLKPIFAIKKARFSGLGSVYDVLFNAAVYGFADKGFHFCQSTDFFRFDIFRLRVVFFQFGRNLFNILHFVEHPATRFGLTYQTPYSCFGVTL